LPAQRLHDRFKHPLRDGASRRLKASGKYRLDGRTDISPYGFLIINSWLPACAGMTGLNSPFETRLRHSSGRTENVTQIKN